MKAVPIHCRIEAIGGLPFEEEVGVGLAYPKPPPLLQDVEKVVFPSTDKKSRPPAPRVRRWMIV